jgi:hypothetical protein
MHWVKKNEKFVNIKMHAYKKTWMAYESQTG